MTTTTTEPDLLTQLRTKQQAMWSSGDYNKIAAITVAVNETMVAEAAITPDERVLDIATGTGHAALAAARIGADVVGIDYVPALLDVARRRAVAEDLAVDFVEAPAEELPYADASFDVTVSAIGVMFAADHDRAAREIVRVTRPGGRIVLASWTKAGFVGGMLGIVGRHVPPPPGAQPPVRWGEEDIVADLLGDDVENVHSSLHVVTQRFTDADAFADLFLTYYGPTFTASSKLDDAGKAAIRADLVAHANAFGRPDGTGSGLVTDWEYRVVHATRR